MIKPDSLACGFPPAQPETAGNSQQNAAQLRQDEQRPATPPRTILFLSEDDAFRHTTRAYLEDEGFLVRSCADAARLPTLFFCRSGPGAAHSRVIDLLLIDVDALGTTGLRLAAELTDFEPDLPVIVLSAPENRNGMLTGLKRRGWKFLKQPVRVPDLLEAIHSALAPAQRRRTSGGALASAQDKSSPCLPLGMLKLRGTGS